MRFLILLSVLVLLQIQPVRSLLINEIMYNPSTEMGDDSDLEWIELYADVAVDLSNYSFFVNGKETALPNVSLDKAEYLILARELEDGEDSDNSSFINYYGDKDNSYDVHFVLSNSGASLNLTGNNKTIETVYSDDLGGDGDGYSIELCNGSWRESTAGGGTPGEENGCKTLNTTNSTNSTNKTRGIALSIFLEELLYTRMEYTKLFKITNNEHITGVDDCINASIKYDIGQNGTIEKVDFAEISCLNSVKTAGTGYFLPIDPGNFTLCGSITEATVPFDNSTYCKNFTVIDTSRIACNVAITSIVMSKRILAEKETLKYKMIINNASFPYIISYGITDVFGNIIKKEQQTKNTNTKRFTPGSIDELDRIYFLDAEIHPLCNDVNRTDNKAREFLIVTKSEERDAASNLKIKKILTKEPIFGKAVIINLIVYKGDTNKRVVKLYATDKKGTRVSEETKLYINDKFVKHEFTLPVQLKEDCKLKADYYFLIADGLGVKEKYRLKIMNSSICEDKAKDDSEDDDKQDKDETFSRIKSRLVQEKPLKTMKNGTNRTIITAKTRNATGVIYKSSSSKANSLVPLILVILCSALCAAIILKKL
ncbi:MAG: lamin tail domain-containing protein [Candidatus Nanoarchaeia archaeon]